MSDPDLCYDTIRDVEQVSLMDRNQAERYVYALWAYGFDHDQIVELAASGIPVDWAMDVAMIEPPDIDWDGITSVMTDTFNAHCYRLTVQAVRLRDAALDAMPRWLRRVATLIDRRMR